MNDDDDDDGYESWTEGNWCLLLTTGSSTSTTVKIRTEQQQHQQHSSKISHASTKHRSNCRKMPTLTAALHADDDDDSDDEDNNNNSSSSNDDEPKKSRTGRNSIKHKNAHDKNWNEIFHRLISYKKQYNSTIVLCKYKADPKLGIWVMNQRKLYKNKILSDYREDLLNSIGFVWDPYDTQWDAMLRRLISYKKQHGSTTVSQYSAADSKLGQWVSHQRIWYRNETLSNYRVNLLNSIGFVWNQLDIQWDEMFQRLITYKKHYGSTLVPKRYEDDTQLGKWVDTQRKNYNSKILSVDRINRLESIGFVWDVLDMNWVKMYDRLVSYKKKHKSTQVPLAYTENNQLPHLGNWVSTQRGTYNKEQLLKKRMELLNSIDFVWEAKRRR
jgi:hypothetical protein